MNSNAAASTAPEEPLPESSPVFDDDFAPDVSVAALFASWPAPPASSSSRVREVCVVVALSAFFHAGLAAAAFQPDHDVHHGKRLSRVEVELTRPPEPPKPLVTPIAPAPKPEPKPLAAAPRPNVVEAAPPPLVPSNDTGSSSPAAEDGELYAGSGGLGTAAPPAPEPPPAPAPVKAIEQVIQAREGANYLKNPRPSYPKLAKREGWEGTTLLRVQVQASGKPAAVKVQKSSGHDALDEAAVETVTQWTFVPATQGGTPVAGSVLVPIVFRLQ